MNTKASKTMLIGIALLVAVSLLLAACQPQTIVETVEVEVEKVVKETVVVEKEVEVEVEKTVIVEKEVEVQCETTDNVFFALDWVIFGRHAPYYVAMEKGFFLDQCISITIERGFGSVDTTRRVFTDQADFGFADMSAVVLGVGNEGFDTKVVYEVYANGAPSVHFIQGTGIETVADLEGKTIAGGATSSITAMLPGLLRANGMEPDDVELVTVDVTTLNQLLLSGQVDAILEFPFNNVSLTKLGAEMDMVPDYFLYAEHNFPLYANGIIARQELIDSNPDLVQRFVNAIDEGLRFAVENPEEATEIMRKFHPEIDADVGVGELGIVDRLTVDEAIAANGYGYADEVKVQSTIDLITEFIGLDNDVTPDQIYTNDFVPGNLP
jgi:NitT/TauT family transport system substrate-binding protein